ncbi:hypothetical protein GGR57DRAFT_497931 [Xylariaceae sp. FL1272]|nr:hypothetical protein GGR57DRAFT_497931 [Xylariaceae sp. FL1272]
MRFEAGLPKPATPDQTRPKRHVVLRIQEISDQKTPDDLIQDLNTIATTDSILEQVIGTISRVSLVRVQRPWACATASFRTELLDTELVERFSRASAQVGFEYRYDCNFYGITPIHEDKDGALVDILAVPGLASHAVGSWKAPGGEDIWLRDYLAEDVPRLRILLYGYNTDLLKSDFKGSIEDMGKTLFESVNAFRNGSRRPIILIGHSLGGLLIKEFYDLSEICVGLLFFGVPNHGLRNEQLLSLVDGQPNKPLIRSLVVDKDTEPSEFLDRLSRDFAKCCKDQYYIVSFYERKKSRVVEIQPDGTLDRTGAPVLMVTKKSATSIGITAAASEDNVPVEADHSGLVKFGSRWQGTYLTVKTRIERLATQGVQVISDRSTDRLSTESQRAWANLNDPPYDSFRNSSRLAKPEEGTLQWLLEDDGKPTRGGPPGQGKSMLSNFIVTHLEDCVASNSKVIYYFCSIDIDEAQHNAATVLQSLIIQLCEKRQTLFQVLPSDYTKDSRQFFTASVERLLDIFKHMLQTKSYDRVYCVIDGLDVYRGKDRDGMDLLISGLCTVFSSTPASGKPVAKLMCTSRPEHFEDSTWRTWQKKRLLCDTHDLRLFIASKVGSLGSQFDDMKKDISTQLQDKAGQTFLWIDIIVRKIKSIRYPSRKEVENAIVKSPTELHVLYGQLVKDIVQSDDLHAYILVWVIYSKRPLHYTELSEAVAIRQSPENASYKNLDDCPRLTTDQLYQSIGTLFDVLNDRVFPIHQSVKDFFMEKDLLKGRFGELETRLWPAYVSMAYMNRTGVSDQSRTNGSLFEYTSNFWFAHVESASDIYGSISLKSELPSLVDTASRRVQKWIQCYRKHNYTRDWNILSSSSQLAVDLDIGWLAHVLLDEKVDHIVARFDEVSFRQSVRRHGVVLKVLLRYENAKHIELPRGIVPEIVKRFGTAIVQVLLERRGEQVVVTEEVVKAAAANTGNGEAVMRLLLDRRGEHVVVTEEVVKAAAANTGNGEAVMRLLLDRRGEHVVVTEEVVKAAAANTWNGEAVMRLLLDRRGEHVVVTEEVVKAAAANWNNGEAVIRLLLDRRGEQVVVTEEVVKAAAANLGNGEAVMRLLLD